MRDNRGQAIVALSMKQLFHGDLQGHQIAHINILKRFLLKMCTTKHHTARASVLQSRVHRFILLIYLLVFVLPYKSTKDFLCFERGQGQVFKYKPTYISLNKHILLSSHLNLGFLQLGTSWMKLNLLQLRLGNLVFSRLSKVLLDL